MWTLKKMMEVLNQLHEVGDVLWDYEGSDFLGTKDESKIHAIYQEDHHKVILPELVAKLDDFLEDYSEQDEVSSEIVIEGIKFHFENDEDLD